MSERILVSGAAGMIGTAVLEELLRRGLAVRAADQRRLDPQLAADCETVEGDLRDRDLARRATKGCDRVIHLAAIVGGIGNFHRYPYTVLEANNELTAALVGAALAEGCSRFTYVSSSMVFERATVFPTPESHLDDCPPPRSAYGFSKLAGERYCRAAAEEHPFPFTICRPFNAYGPGEIPDQEPGIAHVVPDLIKKALAQQNPLQIFGDGNQTRTFTHVRDVASGIVTATLSPAAEGEDFNISAAEEITIKTLAGLVWEACGNDLERLQLAHLPSYAVDVRRRWPDTTKAKKLLGWEAQVPLAEGLRETAGWLAARVHH
jgi:UDP-glucose 4-epimerase